MWCRYIADDKPLFDDELIAAVASTDPAAASLLQEIVVAFDALQSKIEKLDEDEFEDRLMHALNAMICCLLAFGDAMDAAGCKPGRAEFRRLILAKSTRASEFETGHRRAIRTAAAYKLRIRLDSSGTNDSQMEAALEVAALLEGLTGSAAVETIRKSVQRFRSNIRGESVFRLNPETMTFARFDAEMVALNGLPGKPGRPKKVID